MTTLYAQSSEARIESPAVPGVSQDLAVDTTRETERDVVRAITINTHMGTGPKLRYLVEGAEEEERERILLRHRTKSYAFHIADWLRRQRDRYHVVALQEVFLAVLGPLQRLLTGRYCQSDFYRRWSGYRTTIRQRNGFRGFRYENVLLSELEPDDGDRMLAGLPGRVVSLARCGFTLAPFVVDGRKVWIGNTHLHAYCPVKRAKQAKIIVQALRGLGDVPVLFLGDFNMVPPGTKGGDFPHGDRDRGSYRNDETPRILLEAGLNIVRAEDEPDAWSYPTGLPNRTLDYVLHSKHWEVMDYRVVREFTLSDHYPVAGTFRLRG
jgi:endonuclease/exonuclease/phosphatase family metal-dependent hydrolase